MKVLVAPLFEGRVYQGSMCDAGGFDGRVEVDCVFFVEGGLTLSPPCEELSIGRGYFKVAVVCVKGRCVRVLGVDYEARPPSWSSGRGMVV